MGLIEIEKAWQDAIDNLVKICIDAAETIVNDLHIAKNDEDKDKLVKFCALYLAIGCFGRYGYVTKKPKKISKKSNCVN